MRIWISNQFLLSRIVFVQIVDANRTNNQIMHPILLIYESSDDPQPFPRPANASGRRACNPYRHGYYALNM